MTKREFLQTIANSIENAELAEFAKEELEKMDTANAKRREKASEKKLEAQPFVDKFVSYLDIEPKTAGEIAELMEADGVERPDGKAINTQWISSLAKRAVEDEICVKTDVKRTGKGTVKGYCKAV